MRSTALPFIPNRSRALALGIRAALLCLPLASVVPGVALAQSATQQTVRSYDIPAGPLSSALSRFAGEAGVLLSVDGSLLQGLQSNGLQGQYGVDDGFAALLQGSGLQTVRDGQGNYSLARRTAQTGAVELQPMTVEGFALGNALGSMEGYNATHSSVATKTSMPLVRTSQSVSVVTREQIDKQGSMTVAEAVRYTPGVLSNPYGNTRRYDYLAMRGINDGSVDNIIIDGLKSMGDPGSYSSLQIDPYFIERIDVLKGPSSVLYGRSNPGGLASLTTKRPQFTDAARIDLTYGSNDYKSLGFDVTGPLNENIAYRVVGVAKDADSQVDYVEETRYTLMPSLTLNLSEDTSLNLYAYLQRDPNGGYHGSLPASGTLDKRNGRRLSGSFFEGDPDIEEFKRTQTMVGYEFQHRFNDVWSARQNVRYLDAEVENSQVWQSGYYGATSDLLYRGFSGGEESLHAWIVDNMLQSEFATGSALHTVVFGLDYQYTKNKTLDEFDFTSVSPLDIANPIYPDNALSDLAVSSNALRRQKQAGLYVQDLIELGSWNLSLGLRQDWYDVSIDDAVRGKDANQGEKLSGHVGVLYAFENGISPYLSYSTSFNPTSNYSSGAQILEPTTGKQWETGVKYQPVGSDDLYTLSFFTIDMENLFAKENSLVTDNFYKGVGGVKSRGVELEARVSVTQNLRLLGSVTLNDVEYSKSYYAYNSAGGVVDAKGNTPYQTPERMASLWADYNFADELLAGLNIGAGARYVGYSWGNDAHDFKVPSYTLFDASIGYDLGRVGLKGTSVRLNANNLTDEYYVASCYNASSCYLGAERNVVATITHQF
ncbi:TonB-dependent siderophore receptor [Pseudomonas stutzeri]|uniref:TonB-dependent siderophore receptor n=2 Tax=Stutzerimonas stutzeri TaxID=316 RepID=A0A2N8RWT2_STUST|nr:TonB-dependent siderophore receptor [Stutzerimonas stutzeri]MCQ4297939.1 TonB-dependent siderophore receptor [Stutzerimonas stutzeri]PNF78834.1 TonB-dependent siderophore receptor [Stutzerimonas stutzeri]